MSAETELYAALAAAPAVLAIVGTRIYPDDVPQEVALPALAFLRSDTQFVNTIHGNAPVATNASIEIWCLASRRMTADELADACINAIPAAGFVPIARRADKWPIPGTDQGLLATVATVDFLQ